MPRKPDIGWSYGKCLDGDRRKSQCNFCKKVMWYGGVRRLKRHLAGQWSDAEKCKSVPEDVRLLMWKHLEEAWIQRDLKETIQDHRKKPSVVPLAELPRLVRSVFFPRDEICLLLLRSKKDDVPEEFPYIINSPVNIYVTRPDHILKVAEYFYTYIEYIGRNKMRRHDKFGGYWNRKTEMEAICKSENLKILGYRTKYEYKNDGLEHKYTMEVWSLIEDIDAERQKNDKTLVFCRLWKDNWVMNSREQRDRIEAAAAEVVEGGALADVLEAEGLAAAAAQVAAEKQQPQPERIHILEYMRQRVERERLHNQESRPIMRQTRRRQQM